MKTKNLLLAATAIAAFAMTVTAQTIPSYIPTNGLVGWWPFNGNANDESGNGYHGIKSGGITNTTDRFGNSNKAFLFNGIDGVINLPSLNSLSYRPITYSAWVLVNSYLPSSWGHKFKAIIGRNTAFILDCGVIGLFADNGIYDNTFLMWRGGGTSVLTTSKTIPQLNTWVHIVYTQKINGDFNWYQNGVLVNTGNFTDSQNHFNFFQIGSCNNQSNWNTFWDGKLDDILVYNRALTQTEITQLYTYTNCVATTSTTNLTIPSTSLPYTWNGLTFNATGSLTKHLTNAAGCDSTATLNLTVINTALPSYLPANGLVAWYPFNGNANDESGNGNHGIKSGGITNTTDRFGNSNKAFLFNGIDGVINLPSLNSLSYRPITYSAWVLVNSYLPSSWGHKFKAIIGRNTAFILDCGVIGLFADNGIYDNTFLMWRGGGTSVLTTSKTIPQLNTWVHIVYTQKINGDFNWYQNGVLVNTGNFTDSQNHFNFFQIGSCNNQSNWNTFWDGKLDDILVYNRALTQTEITQLYTNCVATTSTTNLTIPSTSLPYTWNGLTFNAAGSQTKHLTNAAGCDSTATLNLTVINTALPSYLPANGLVGWWPFNGNANDESGNGNYGTVNGATLTTDRNGVAGKAYSFDGSTNFIKVLNSATLSNLNSNISIAGWIKSNGTFASIVCKSNLLNQNGDFRFFINDNSTALFSINGYKFYVMQNVSLSNNNWSFFVITHKSNNTKIYLNGQLVSSNSTYTNQQTYDNLTDLYIGRDPWGADEFTNGKLDDIAIYNRALTQTEITAFYQNTIKLNLTTFLEGSYADSSSMTATANKINAAIPSSIADSIIVELHSSTSPYATMYSSNGVVNTNGTASISFPNSTLDSSYYIVIKHRNSIETWSASPVTISNHTIYNFTTSASQAYGANLSNLGKGVFGIYSGDITQDGSVDFNDYPTLDIASNDGILGYDVNDLNGDASVDFNDYPILDVNSNIGVIVVRP